MKKLVTILCVCVFSCRVVCQHEIPKLNQINNYSVSFEENKGQIKGIESSKVTFQYHNQSLSVFLLKNGIAYQFTQAYQNKHKETNPLYTHDAIDSISIYRMDLQLVNSNPDPIITTEGKSQDYTNYCSNKISKVYSYKKITYHNIYPKIDWVIYASNNQVKYDFIVHPGGNPDAIKFRTKWVENLELKHNGSLSLSNRLGKITEQKPISFQSNKKIATSFLVKDNIISFDLSKYDHTKPLIIDPLIEWFTYYGGTNLDYSCSSATDFSGNSYLLGETNSTTGIAQGGYSSLLNTNGIANGYSYQINRDAFVVKFNEQGVRQWATYYGGEQTENAGGIVTDDSGNIYISGTTKSTQNMAINGFQNNYGGGISDAFVSKLNSNGELIWASYYGGTKEDIGSNLAIDNENNIFFCGKTSSNNGIAANGHNTVGPVFANGMDQYSDFLVKFSENGNRLWGTYYGLYYYIQFSMTSCTVDNQGQVYLCGTSTNVTDIATAGAYQEIPFGNEFSMHTYLVKFTSNGNRIWGTSYGGEVNDFSMCCTTDASGNVYICGYVFGIPDNIDLANYWATPNAHQTTSNGNYESFIAAFDSNGQRIWATFYGGSSKDIISHCTTDENSVLLILGSTESTTSIATSDADQAQNNGLSDSFLAFFSITGNLIYATYIGGSQNQHSHTICLDNNQNIFINGCTEGLIDIDANGHQTQVAGEYDAFFLKYSSAPFLVDAPENLSICSGHDLPLQVTTTPTNLDFTYAWSGPNNFSSNEENPILSNVTELNEGTYSVTVSNNGNTVTKTFQINIVDCNFTISQNGPVCLGETINLSIIPNENNEAYTVDWITPNGNLETSFTLSIPNATYENSGVYTANLNYNGVTTTNTIEIQIVDCGFTIKSDNSICKGDNLVLAIQTNEIGENYSCIWTGPNNFSSTEHNPIISNATTENSGQYTVQLTVNGFTYTKSIFIEIINCEANCNDIYVPTSFSPDEKGPEENNTIKVYGDCISELNFAIFNRWGEKVFETSDSNTKWDGTYQGKILNSGSYAFKLYVKLNNQSVIEKSGNISIVR